jgi:hypothetical protein
MDSAIKGSPSRQLSDMLSVPFKDAGKGRGEPQ